MINDCRNILEYSIVGQLIMTHEEIPEETSYNRHAIISKKKLYPVYESASPTAAYQIPIVWICPGALGVVLDASPTKIKVLFSESGLMGWIDRIYVKGVTGSP